MAHVDVKSPTIINDDRLQKIFQNPDDDDDDNEDLFFSCQEAVLKPEERAAKEQEQLESGGREKLFRHWNDVAGRVYIPEKWGKEMLLKDWMDCSIFDDLLAPKEAVSAREALIAERKRVTTRQLINMERMISN